MIYRTFGAAALAALLTHGPGPGAVTLDLVGGTDGALTDGAASVLFTDVDGSGINVALSPRATNNPVPTAEVLSFSGGAGVQVTSQPDSGLLDGGGPNERLIFVFSEPVIVTAISFAEVEGNDDADIQTSQTPGGGGFTVVLNNADVSSGLLTGNFVGLRLGIRANGENDDFRITGLDFMAVPLPPALAPMVLALAGLGWVGRRRSIA